MECRWHFFTWHMHFIIILILACFQECVLPVWVSFATSYRMLLCGSGFQQKRRQKRKILSARTKVEKLALRELCVDHWASWRGEGGLWSLSGNWLPCCWCLNAACQPYLWGEVLITEYVVTCSEDSDQLMNRKKKKKLLESSCEKTSWLVWKHSWVVSTSSGLWRFKWPRKDFLIFYVWCVDDYVLTGKSYCKYDTQIITPKLKGKNNFEYWFV